MNQNTLTPWTAPAERLFEAWLAVRLHPDRLEGADPAELREDLRSHLENELAEARVSPVTEDALRRVLLRMGEDLPGTTVASAEHSVTRPEGFPARVADAPKASAAEVPPPVPDATADRAAAAPWVRPRYSIDPAGTPRSSLGFVLIFLPIAAVVTECLTRGSALMAFDPLHDFWHWMLVLSVPAGAILALRECRRAQPCDRGWRRIVPVLLGMGLVACAWYALLFLPVFPAAMMAILALGAGLLLLAPTFGVPAMMVLQRRFSRRGVSQEVQKRESRMMWTGAALAFLTILLTDFRGGITGLSVIRWHKSASDEARAEEVRLLRSWGDRETLLSLCGDPELSSRTPGQWLANQLWRPTLVTFDAMRSVETRNLDGLYFAVTGELLSDAQARSAKRIIKPMRGLMRDTNRGGTAVAGFIPGLSLNGLRTDWHVDSASGMAWGECTITFSNTTRTAQEARCRMGLPPDGCVSRVLLWVNGEPQEAAYAGNAAVRAAYQKVAVEQRRDPVLVTQPDASSIMLQAFPVPAGGTMKMRLTFTAPVPADGRVWMPVFGQRNFEIDESMPWHYWVQSDVPDISAPADLKAVPGKDGAWTILSGTGTAGNMTGTGAHFTCRVAPAPVLCTTDPFVTEKKHLIRRLEPAAAPHDAVVAVVDTSVGMETHADALAEALDGLPALQAVFMEGDTPGEIVEVKREFGKSLRSQSFEGGRNSAGALASAFQSVSKAANPLVIWLHGPQPASEAVNAALDQRTERGGVRGTLVDIPLNFAENSALSALSRCGRLLCRSLRWDHTAAHLRALLNATAAGPAMKATWEAVEALPAGMPQTGDVLARYHALETARTMSLSDTQVAASYAAAHQLVTPWSGAVVLERAADYAANGLKQAGKESVQQVPVVPEPGTGALLVSSVLFLMRRRRR